jgi:hypothetical protein
MDGGLEKEISMLTSSSWDHKIVRRMLRQLLFGKNIVCKEKEGMEALAGLGTEKFLGYPA